jgi:NAD+ kinase
MTSTSGSQQQSQPVSSAAIVTHGRVDVHDAVERAQAVAHRCGVQLVDDAREADIAVVLGGDGTILRTLAHLLGADVPVIGVNFGRVGFLASIKPAHLERSLERVFAGEYLVTELPTLELALDGQRHVAVNDVVATSSTLGRMVELAWSVAGEDLGVVPCDGVICSTPSGSTAYNLSNGGPVLERGLDAMAITFIAPHSLHARPLVLGRGSTVTIRNDTVDVGCAVLVDGHRTAELQPGGSADVYLCRARTLLATLPETSFFRRYRETFAS